VSLISSHLTSLHLIWALYEATQFAVAVADHNKLLFVLIGRRHGQFGRFTAQSVQTNCG